MKIRFILLFLTFFCAHYFSRGQALTSPKEHFGFNIGDDYHLANFTQTEAYFKKLAQSSDRVKLVTIGKTEEGRDQPMLIVTSPENHKNLNKYQEISVKLARAERLTDSEAQALSQEGKAVVWIDGGLHATETVATHQLIETAWQLVSRNDAETRRILDNVIILLVHANPDGQELVSNWYMRHADPKKRSLQHLPVLYHKYVGHDNNRDFYMFNLSESRNIGRQLFVDWIPQIMYNHHQRGPAGTVLAGPPYRDPFNHVFDPLVITGIDAVGAAMYNRLNAEKKPGFTRLGGSVFSTWYNGGLRTTTYFHNMIGLLTEIAGGPTPEEIALVPDRMIPDNNTPYPATPHKFHFRQAIDYSVSLNYAVLDYAARHSDALLFNIYLMGSNSIAKGSADSWTHYPKRIQEIKEAHLKTLPKGSSLSHRATVPTKLYDSVFVNSDKRDPRAYIIPLDQKDFATAVKFVNTLIRGGIRVERAKSSFNSGGRQYPKGSLIVKTDQAFRPHILDMFEPQDYPNDFAYPGGPPVAPYDAAGWTLAYQMGVTFDRSLDALTGDFEILPYGETLIPSVTPVSASAGYILSAGVNDSFRAVNRLVKNGIDVFRVNGAGATDQVEGFYVPDSKAARSLIQNMQKEFGLAVKSVDLKKASSRMEKLTRPLKIALWDTYGGSMPSGWIRWLLEQFEYDFTVLYARDFEREDILSGYDLLIFPGGAIPAVGSDPTLSVKEENIPSEHHFRLGRITSSKTIPVIRKYIESGGKVVTIGSSANLAYQLELPVWSVLTEVGADGARKPLPGEKYYVPGSILRVKVDTTEKANAGMGPFADVYFDRSPVFGLSAEAIAAGRLKPLAWYEASPLRSGWAWGQAYLANGVAAFRADVGKGQLFVFGPEMTFRAQSHGTFRWLFNQLH